MNAGKWRYASASAIGAAHLSQNTVCQDRLLCRAVETAEGEVLIAAVADGAGSTSDGQRGAEIACEFFVSQVTAFLNSGNAAVSSLNIDFGKLWIAHCQTKIAAAANAEKKKIRDFASTFVGAVVGENGAAFYQIGDGAAIFSASGKPESYRFAIAPLESEYVNMTDFITDQTAVERLRYVFIAERLEDLILFSDGIFAVAVDYQTNQPHEPFLIPMIAPLRKGSANAGLNQKLESFLASPKLNEKTDDDKTIVLASRAEIGSRESLTD